MQYDVFISYSRKDIAAAETLCRALDEGGVKYWIDRNMHGSVNFLSEITRYIRNAKAVLFIASANSAKSEWTQKEILYAIKHKKTIIPYRLGKFHFEENEELDFVFTNVQWIDSLESVVDTLQKLGLTHQKRVVPPTPPHPTEPRRPKWLWALALMPLLLIGLWFGLRGKTYQVGDYYDDGTKQGVVFEVDESGRHGKIVGLNAVELQWCTGDEYDRNVLTGAKDKDNGRNNQVCIQQIADWRSKYPAFAWCVNQGEGWYLPSLNEVKTIYFVKDKVDKTLEKMSSDKFQNGWYWSSTEEDEFCAWLVYMLKGYTFNHTKDGNYYVRAVSAF